MSLKRMTLNVVKGLIFAIALALCSCDDEPAVPGPTQSQFCDAIRRYTRSYAEASNAHENEVALSQIRAARKETLRTMMKGGQEFNWTGHIQEISTDSEREAHLQIVLTCGPVLELKGASPFKPDVVLRESLPIKADSPVYAALASLKEEQEVVFDGIFDDRGDLRDDFIHEHSITEVGSMTRPEFSFTFTRIRAAAH